MKNESNSKYKRKNEALLEIVNMIPGFSDPKENNSNRKAKRMYWFISERIGVSADTDISIRLQKHLKNITFSSVADFDEYICKLNVSNLPKSP